MQVHLLIRLARVMHVHMHRRRRKATAPWTMTTERQGLGAGPDVSPTGLPRQWHASLIGLPRRWHASLIGLPRRFHASLIGLPPPMAVAAAAARVEHLPCTPKGAVEAWGLHSYSDSTHGLTQAFAYGSYTVHSAYGACRLNQYSSISDRELTVLVGGCPCIVSVQIARVVFIVGTRIVLGTTYSTDSNQCYLSV